MPEATLPLIPDDWKNSLKCHISADVLINIENFLLKEESEGSTVYPPKELIFNALTSTPLNEVKVVILGQDPYHGPKQAHGLSFSVPDGVHYPPSLQNIFKEIEKDCGIERPTSGNLTKWAQQGVLLLNAMLTVRAGEAGSHRDKGWEEFTDAVIKTISDHQTGVIFVLWGRFAKGKQQLIDADKHFILTAPHPSPFSAHSGFFGCSHFSKTNEILRSIGRKPIDWSL